MGDDDSDPHSKTELLDIELDEAPTERIPLDSVKPETDPTHMGVLSSEVAATIRAEHAPTIDDADQLTFVGIVDSEGRILVPDRIRESSALQPGDEFLIRAQKVS